MEIQTAERKMLYCPKCERKYENGSQRFCNNDGSRLLPAVNEGIKREMQTNGVFTNLLTRSSSSFEDDEQIAATPRFERRQNTEPDFKPTVKNIVPKPAVKPALKQIPKTPEMFRMKDRHAVRSDPASNISNPHAVAKPEVSNGTKPISRRLKSSEIEKINRAGLGERIVRRVENLIPVNQNPQLLIGQTVKGRYEIISVTDQDQISVVYSGRDRIENKKVIVRVLIYAGSGNDFQNKLLAEERVSLSHIDHPNIVKVFDSGELATGEPFIVTASIENETVRAFQQKSGVFNPLRTARIILQSSMALSEVHQNGILHRNLQPQHIVLTMSEIGNESARVTDFCVSDGRLTSDNFAYKSPEQINGQLPTYASDGFSLAVIAYQMLTGNLPFKGITEGELYKLQKAGSRIEPTDINSDLSPLIDAILTKALAYNPADRYPKARDFGEAFYNALVTSAPWKDDSKTVAETKETNINISPTDNDFLHSSIPIYASDAVNESVQPNSDQTHFNRKTFDADIPIDSDEDEYDEIIEFDNADFGEAHPEHNDGEISTEKNETLWEKRSPEPTREGGRLLTLLSVLGLLVIVAGGFGAWRYFNNLDEPITASAENQAVSAKEPTIKNDKPIKKAATEEIEVPPPAREITAPKNFEFFENSKENLSEDLARNFRGFSLYYPKSWSKYETSTNYLDVKLKDNDGFPKQQFIVTRYESKGNYNQDEKLFPKLVEKSDNDLTKFLPSYEVVSQGKINVNNGWKAYEVKFKGRTEFKDGSENFEIWGRRIWMPAARPGVENGFVITMLATSLSDKIESLDDVGIKGELGDILYTFEPNSNY